MSLASNGASHIQIDLHFENQGGAVRVVAPEKHIMVVPVLTAIAACKAFQDQIAFIDQFNALLDRLAAWIVANQAGVSTAFLTVQDEGLLFLVIQEGKIFDEALESELSDLSIELANEPNFSLIRVTMHALPNCSRDIYEAFLSNNMQLRYVGNAK